MKLNPIAHSQEQVLLGTQHVEPKASERGIFKIFSTAAQAAAKSEPVFTSVAVMPSRWCAFCRPFPKIAGNSFAHIVY